MHWRRFAIFINQTLCLLFVLLVLFWLKKKIIFLYFLLGKSTKNNEKVRRVNIRFSWCFWPYYERFVWAGTNTSSEITRLKSHESVEDGLGRKASWDIWIFFSRCGMRSGALISNSWDLFGIAYASGNLSVSWCLWRAVANLSEP